MKNICWSVKEGRSVDRYMRVNENREGWKGRSVLKRLEVDVEEYRKPGRD
jgi:hypothetical protein